MNPEMQALFTMIEGRMNRLERDLGARLRHIETATGELEVSFAKLSTKVTLYVTAVSAIISLVFTVASLAAERYLR